MSRGPELLTPISHYGVFHFDLCVRLRRTHVDRSKAGQYIERGNALVVRRQSTDHAGSRQSPHFGDSRRLQHARTCVQRRACRADIVDEQDTRSHECRCRRSDCERVAHVSVTPAGGQTCLRGSRPHATERCDDRDVHLTREIRGLVEPAVPPAGRMERHRYHARGAGQGVGSPLAHQSAQRAGERSPSFIFERVYDRAQRRVVRADGSRAVDRPAPSPAPGAASLRHAHGTPCRQRVAAAIAQRWSERHNRSPASFAHRPTSGMNERPVAGGASGREDDGKDGV